MTLWKNFRLFNRQTQPADILQNQRSLLVYHSPGSGKTFAALYAVHKLSENEKIIPHVIVIAPAKVILEIWRPTVSNIRMANSFTLISYELARSRVASILSSIEHNKKVGTKYIVICDEVHVVRNVNTKSFHAVFSIASKAYKLILLTGTPIINSIEDVIAIVRLLKNNSTFKFKASSLVESSTLRVINLEKFISLFSGYVNSYKLNSNTEDYPEQYRSVRTVNMYPLQKLRYHEFVVELLTPTLRALMDEGIISNALNPFLVRTRAISNTVGKFSLPHEKDDYERSEKFQGIRKSILEGPKPAVIYSFFLSNGVIPMKTFLDETTSLKTAVISGLTPNKIVNKTISDYNFGKLDVLLITSTVRQGITLLKTRILHIMEPSWNESMIEQIIGRVVRFHSHVDLPLNERNVHIYTWITHYSSKLTSTDEYIYDLAERKQKVISVFEKALIKIGTMNKN